MKTNKPTDLERAFHIQEKLDSFNIGTFQYCIVCSKSTNQLSIRRLKYNHSKYKWYFEVKKLSDECEVSKTYLEELEKDSFVIAVLKIDRVTAAQRLKFKEIEKPTEEEIDKYLENSIILI